MKKIFNRKNGVKSVYTALMILALIIVILVNIVMGVLADRYPLSIDLTSAGLFGLSDGTAAYLKTLQTPVTIQVLAKEDVFENNSTYNAQANEVMRQFAKHADKVNLRYIDYVADPTFASKYPDFTLKHGDVIVSGGGKDRLVKTEELFNYAYSDKGEMTIASSRAEEAILSAILYVTSDSIPKVAVVQGHNEASSSAFTKLLTENNYAVENVNLLMGQLTEDTEIVLLAAPATDLTAEEIDALDAFLKNDGAYGKTLFYCAGPEQPKLPNLDTYLADWGIAVGDGLVFETDAARVYSTQPFYTIADYTNTTFSAMLRDTKVPMLVPVSRPLDVLFAQQESYTTQTLLSFGATAGVRPADAGEGFTSADATRKGPMPALVLASYQEVDATNANRVTARSQILASGSVALLDTYAVGNSSFANAEYLMNVLNTLCERTDTVAVTPKTIVGNALNITQSKADLMGYLFILAIPLVVLAMGIFVWLSRRHK